jgi:metal transporter CNNM
LLKFCFFIDIFIGFSIEWDNTAVCYNPPMLILITVVLIALAALFSGLNLGLMSLDSFELKRKADLGDADAKKVYAIRSHGNRLLVTLLVGNVAVISALSIVFDSAFHGLVAGLLTTLLITIFGEILPQAIVARYSLSIGAFFAGVVRLVMFILYPVCAPMAWVLDRVLGDELPTVYSKQELAKLIEDHEHYGQSGIDKDEARIARGALTFGDRKIRSVMTPLSGSMMLAATTSIDRKLMASLKEAGYSRVPVYTADHDDVTGILYAKDLVGLAAGTKRVGEVARPTVHFVDQDGMLDDALNAFLKTRNHLFVVTNKDGEVRGIVTIEDVLEEIIDREITDEFDHPKRR